jgi:hypothetical protein
MLLATLVADATMSRLRMPNIPAKAVVLQVVRPRIGVMSKNMDALPKSSVTDTTSWLLEDL